MDLKALRAGAVMLRSGDSEAYHGSARHIRDTVEFCNWILRELDRCEAAAQETPIDLPWIASLPGAERVPWSKPDHTGRFAYRFCGGLVMYAPHWHLMDKWIIYVGREPAVHIVTRDQFERLLSALKGGGQ